MFAGMCVNAMVRMSPRRAASRGARSCDRPPSTPADEEHRTGRAGRQVEPQVEPQHQQRRDHEPAAGRVEAEQCGELADRPPGGAQHSPRPRASPGSSTSPSRRSRRYTKKSTTPASTYTANDDALRGGDVPVVAIARATPVPPTTTRRPRPPTSPRGCRRRRGGAVVAHRRARRRTPARSGGRR